MYTWKKSNYAAEDKNIISAYETVEKELVTGKPWFVIAKWRHAENITSGWGILRVCTHDKSLCDELLSKSGCNGKMVNVLPNQLLDVEGVKIHNILYGKNARRDARFKTLALAKEIISRLGYDGFSIL